METARSYNSTSALTFTDSTSTTANFAYGKYSGAVLAVSATTSSAAQVLTFYAKPASDSSENYALHNASNSAITITVQPNRCYELPKELFGANTVAATAPSSKTVTCKVYLKG
jgi:hypothetical protein